uniref:Calpain catalytic domain-containing protein n=1 Tax=Cyprinodon variegatus TaxID=28743 RepID=A0A3Q2DZI7_CYPVA
INGRPIFVQSKKQNEFWPSLLEKAYAKVCGSYADMNAGTLAEAMVDFTGGVHMCIQLSDPPSDLWESMSRAGRFGALMGCSTPKGESSSLSLCPNGLVQGHAYTVTGVIQVMSRGKPVKIVRLWNPWGKGEWNGDWSDQSSIWKTVSPQDRENCLSVAEDGEFWMTLEDLCEFYTELDLCGLNPDFLDEDSSGLWRSSIAEGRWVAGTTAGGCMNNRETFWTNPQFRIKVWKEISTRTAAKNILVSLMQKPDKRNRHLVQNFHIGFTVFERSPAPPHKGKFPASFFSAQKPAAQTKTFINAREVMEFLTLMPGEYVIVPSTFNPNETSSFILTIHCRTETLC